MSFQGQKFGIIILQIMLVIRFSLAIRESSTRSTKTTISFTDSTADDNAFIYGTPVDFEYNDTLSESEPYRRISSPGCPRSMEGIIEDYDSFAPWVYYGKEKKCYLTGIQGPCARGMKLSINPQAPTFGVCKCNCFLPTYASFIKRDHVWKPLETDRTFCYDEDSKMHFAFVSTTNQCYPLLDQGPCLRNEWLVIDSKTNLPKCETRMCVSGQFFEKETSSCQTIGSRCQNSNLTNCNEFECVYLRDELSWTPVCKQNNAVTRFAAVAISPFDCLPLGKRYTKVFNKCVDVIYRRRSEWPIKRTIIG